MTGATSEAWRFSRVEKKILRCAAAGETADFTADSEDGRKPEVSGEFLARLWLGVIKGAEVHPFGISIKGLSVVGSFSVGGGKQTIAGRETLVGFMAEECTFGEPTTLEIARTESLFFSNCDFKSLNLEAAEIVGALELGNCRLGTLNLNNATIHARLIISSCTIQAQCALFSTVVEGPAFIIGCRIGGDGSDGTVLGARYARFDGTLLLSRCRFVDGVVDLESAEAQEVIVTRCSVRSGAGRVALSAAQLRTRGSVRIDRVLLSGALALGHASIAGQLLIHQLMVAQRGPGLFCIVLTGARISQDMRVRDSILSGTIGLGDLSVEHAAELTGVKVRTSPGYWSILATRARFGELRLKNCRFSEGAEYAHARIAGPVEIGGVSVGPAAGGRRYGVDEERRATCATSFATAQIEGRLTIGDSFFEGYLNVEHASVGAGVFVSDTVVATSAETWSVTMPKLSTAGVVVFVDAGLTSGLVMAGARCWELQLQGTDVGSCEIQGEIATSVWATDLELDRRLFFGASRHGRRCNRFRGTLQLQNGRFGENVWLASSVIELPERTEIQGLARAIDFARSRVSGDMILADRRVLKAREIDFVETPASVHGCVVLDDVEVAGDIILHRTAFIAQGDVVRPHSQADTEERVTKRKRGVAISMHGAKAGGLEVGRPSIHGLVDLRDADIGMIADGSGRRWARAGCGPGHLLLDGLVYRDLDDVWDGEDDDASLRPQSEAAAQRLHWLDMQYPDGQPTPDLFVPQPYEQLARIFAAEGDERARRQVLVAKRELQRRHGRLSRFERSVGWILKLTSDYGYSPLRAVLSLLIFIAVGSLLAWLLDSSSAIVLASTDATAATPFNPVVYAFDAALPIVDLNQDNLFTIDVARLPPWARSEAVVTLIKAAYEMVGLMLASIAILTLTGTLREKE